MTELKRGEFLIQSYGPNYTFIGEFGDLATLPDPDSYGGWGVTSIPKRMGLTEWAGRNPMVLPIDFLIDRLQEGDVKYVDDMRDRLDKIAATASRDDEPPVCIFESGGLAPHDFTRAPHVLWVVSALEWSRDLTVNQPSTRMPLRVGGTITLTQYNNDDVIDAFSGSSKRNRERNMPQTGTAKVSPSRPNVATGSGGINWVYHTRDGDDLVKIAARLLGSSKRWREIGGLNNIRDGHKTLKTNTALRMPPQ